MTDVSVNEYREQRLANMRELKSLGYAPYGQAFDRSALLADIRESFEEEKAVRAAGRLVTIRDMGKSIFADLRDGTDRFQIYVQKKALGEESFAAFKLLDIGDHVGVAGVLFTTRTGEATIKVAEWTLLSKALLPLPEKWHGLQDVEARYRQRYLDLISNPEVRERFNQRISIVREMRAYLQGQGFQEVETPIMQPEAGGAAAKPFATHYDALGADMFLRIAPELYLKRLLVGGFDKVFELNRCFRNEGVDRTHTPEFTMLEIYQAYTDVEGMKALIEGLIKHLADTVLGTRQFSLGEDMPELDLDGEWRDVNYRDLIVERMGADWYELDIEAACARATEAGLEMEPGWDMTMVSHEVYEKLVEHTLLQPTFVRRLPAALIPLAKACPDDPTSVDVFELVIGGQEIAPAYTELNDPTAQRQRLTEQAGDDPESVDEDFLTALEHGMPPAGGMGMGVDRIVMLLTGASSLRETMLFPQLKRRG